MPNRRNAADIDPAEFDPKVIDAKDSDAEGSDALTRRRIEEDLDKNFLIEAAAGTGKTTSMVNRMVSLIANGACRIDQLVAVTFTRKAAAELRERFQAELRQQAASMSKAQRSQSPSEPSRSVCERLRDASDHQDRAFVGTIHAFCACLLRERPIEFNVHPSFQELDEQEDMIIREQAWQENANELLGSNDPLITQLKELGLDRQQLKQQFHRFIDFRDVENWPHQPPSKIDLASIQAQTRDYVDDMKRLLPLFPAERGRDTLMGYYEEIVRASDRNWQRLAHFFDLLEKFDRSHGVVQKQWHDKRTAKSESQRWDQFRRELVKPALAYWYQLRYQVAIEFLKRALAIYEQTKAASGRLDFNDLLLLAARGLKSQPELRRYFQSRYSHLLVDEFQDTDPIQAELILYLVADNAEQQDWLRCVPRPGALFAVGDPKQSIYRFRRGDIVTYNRVKQIFESTGGEVLPLVKNFRSRADLIAWNNTIYRQKFPQQANPYAPAAEDMVPGRQDDHTGEFHGLHQLPVDSSLNIEAATEQEADAIARFIRYAIDSGMSVPRTERELASGRTAGVEARDFLIVPYRKKRIACFKQALDRYGIPNEVSGVNALVGIPQIDSLIDILRCVDDPSHAVYLLAVLRDRVFGFDDQELYRFKKMGGRFQFTATVPVALDDQLRSRFETAFDRLRKYQAWLRALPFVAAVSKISEDLGLLPAAAGGLEGNVSAGGLLKAIEGLRLQGLKFDSVADLIGFWEQYQALDESEGCTALPPEANVVRVMNLHKAKGLEAPIVFLTNTSTKSDYPVVTHIDRNGDEPVGYMGLSVKQGKRFRSLAIPHGWEQYQAEEKNFNEAESDRLLYVATTRAACALIVSIGKRNSNWGDLHDYITDAPRLHIPSDQELCEVLPKRKSSRIPGLEPLTAEQIRDKWDTAARPSYRIATMKDLGLKGITRPRWETSGDYGYRWGSAVHELLEICHKSPQSNLLAAAVTLANQHALGSERVQELVETVESVVRSVLWKRAQAASQCFSELPFETTVIDPSDQPTIVRGVIDLIFEEPGGWVLVDYKSDAIGKQDIANAVDFYRNQLDQYASHWADVTQSKVAECGLYFTKLQRYVRC
ncbi:MAG: UvrD-helicase domain-containing protein [bacterium]|nr:UvrD-helicase domain-containing protein [bacterium]